MRAVVAEYEATKKAALAKRDAALRAFHAAGWRAVDLQRVTGYSRETTEPCCSDSGPSSGYRSRFAASGRTASPNSPKPGTQRPEMDPFHERLARLGLAAADRFGFALAGGYAELRRRCLVDALAGRRHETSAPH
ncbi:hypothetical protein AB0M46_22325 [Dactylosporangium sp. NPDC051485]|uniref:hypothetical protein n=1 Tax=Dactylosporangium sp. NPDC051485 TaxID=3154846 RepID=UPI00341AC8E3